MIIPLLKNLEFIELCLPCRFMRMPNKINRVQLFNSVGCHGGGKVFFFKFLILVALPFDPSGKYLITLIGMRYTRVSMLELEIDKLLEHDSPLMILGRTESPHSALALGRVGGNVHV